ncbi:MAG: hypothetical protein R8M11_02235 [Gallionella sp.]
MKVFNDMHFGNVLGDLFGGVTAAVIALPMALAFGVAPSRYMKMVLSLIPTNKQLMLKRNNGLFTIELE